jgi:DUF4097 and DUF4098 domain-containing protein YvlB
MRQQTFQTPGPIVLDVRSTSGSVRVDAIDGLADTTVTVKSVKGDRDIEDDAVIEAREDGGRQHVSVHIPGSKLFGFIQLGAQDVDISVRCPAGSEPTIDVVSAEVVTNGKLGKAVIKGVSGDLAVERIDGDASLRTISGDLSVADVVGRATCQTVSGAVRVQHAGGPSEFRSISGDFRLGRLDGPVSVQSVSGDIEVDSIAQGAVTLKTVSGDMRIGVRQGARIWIDARSVGGRTTSELPVSDQQPAGDGPFVELRATATSGNIRVVKAG